MVRERYVLLGLGRARAEWFRRVGQWATSAVIPAEFVRCVSAGEVRTRLDSGRAFSALIAESGQPGVDRELLAVARTAGVPTLVVDGLGTQDWVELGAAGVLAPEFTRDDLIDALAMSSQMIGAADVDAPDVATRDPGEPTRHGRVVAVIGGGGVGTSTTAIAIAQGLAADRPARGVVLADMCRHADQAMLHHSTVVVPGIQELVEAHRHDRPSPQAVRDETWAIPERGYRLLLGLRRPRQWVALRRHALEAAFESLRATFDAVVCDVEPDLEGEGDTGSVDVEERHLMSRLAVTRADVVVAVARADLQGTHTVVRLLTELLSVGVEVDRVLPVFTQAPRSPRDRAEITRAVADLVRSARGAVAADLASPIFLPDRRVDLSMHDGVALPKAVVDPITGAVRALLTRRPSPQPTAAVAPTPVRVRPGELRQAEDLS